MKHAFQASHRALIMAALAFSVHAAEWQSVASLNTPRNRFAAAIVDQKIVVSGGLDRFGNALNSTEILDLSNPLVWQLTAVNAYASSQLSASGHNGWLYSFGGLDGSQQISDLASAYNVAENRWQVLPNLLTKRAAATAIANGQQILLFGGHGSKAGKQLYFNNIDAFDVDVGEWHQVGKMPSAMEAMALARFDGKIYSFGGSKAVGKVGNAVARFDPLTKKWQRSGFSPVPVPRWFATGQAAPVLNGKVYLIGGQVWSGATPVASNAVSIYDPLSDTWQVGPELPQRLMWHVAVASDEAIYVIGGTSGDNLLSENRVWRLTDSWKSTLSLQQSCDLDGDGKFGKRDGQLFAKGCANHQAYWPCDLNTDQIFNAKDTAAYKAQWKSAKEGCPITEVVSGKLSLSATRLDFGDVVLGQSGQASVTLTNSGNDAILIRAFNLHTAGFNLSHDCGNRLEVAASCTLSFGFTPVVIGQSSDVFSIDSSASASPQSIALQGAGVEPAGKLSLSSVSLNFGSVMIGQTGHASVTLTNSGNAAILFNGFSLQSTGFSISDDCGSRLEVAARCALNFSFTPVVIGKNSDVCSIDSSASASPLTIALQATGVARDDVSIIGNAFTNQLSDIQVQSTGIVTSILSDDVVGGQHQRFILRLSNRQTVLIAHNIDIAPRIASLKVNDSVAFYGEYVWNSQGGLVHWTHHDPAGIHVAGWLKHNGVTYQ